MLKILKSRLYNKKNYHMVKFCQIVQIYKDFENLS